MSTRLLRGYILAGMLVLNFVSSSQAGFDSTLKLAEDQLPEPGVQESGVQEPKGTNSSDVAPSGSLSQDVLSHAAPSASPASKISDCSVLESTAAAHGLPIDFFTRLIKQESNFDPKAVSRAGAQGIAQFMPGTARWRGLSDPFEPVDSLREAARWLRELREHFGNLGLAAAAYNAGPGRVSDWIAGKGSLPKETQAYVRIVTGRTAQEWLGVSKDMGLDQPARSCMEALKLAPQVDEHHEDKNANLASSGLQSWGLQLIGDSSESRALSEYAELQERYHSVLGGRAPTVLKRPLGGRGPQTWYFVRVSEPTRERAMQLCSKLKSIGGSCIVSRN